MALCLLALAAPRAHAQDNAVLVRMLDEGHSFRVRARAALALVTHPGDATVGALEGALGDPHPVVRAAAATALGRVGTRRSVPALRRAAADALPEVSDQAKAALRELAAREAIAIAVPSSATSTIVVRDEPQAPLANVRYVLVVGEMGAANAQAAGDLGPTFGARVLEELRALPYVAVLPLSRMTQTVAEEIQRRRLAAFRIDGTITSLEASVVRDEQRLRCEVSLLIMDEPDRTLRSALKGAASGSEQLRGERSAQLRSLAGKALKGAVRSALANVLQAVEAAAIRRDLGMGSDIRAEASLDRRSKARRR